MKGKGKSHKPSKKVSKALANIVAGSTVASREQWDDWNIRLRTALALAKGGKQGITTDPIERD